MNVLGLLVKKPDEQLTSLAVLLGLMVTANWLIPGGVYALIGVFVVVALVGLWNTQGGFNLERAVNFAVWIGVGAYVVYVLPNPLTVVLVLMIAAVVLVFSNVVGEGGGVLDVLALTDEKATPFAVALSVLVMLGYWFVLPEFLIVTPIVAVFMSFYFAGAIVKNIESVDDANVVTVMIDVVLLAVLLIALLKLVMWPWVTAGIVIYLLLKFVLKILP